MNLTACAAALACTAAVAAGVASTATTTTGDTGLVGDAASFSAPVTLAASDATVSDAAAQCDPSASTTCVTPLAADALTDKVFFLPEPTGDPAKDFKTLVAAIKDTRYDTIEGASGGKRLSYTINGMLEINRSLTIRNLELHQLSTAYAVRTIYAAGGGTPITLRLENLKIERGPANSGATGSVSDSAGIWTVNTTPEFSNVELYGGGHGNGLEIVNATGGHLTDIYVHDITWQPYPADQADPNFWGAYVLATLQKSGDWNGFQILDYDGHSGLNRVRIEEQANGIVLDNVTGLTVLRPRISRIQTQFADGQVFPYQSDGITIVSGNGISIQDGKIDHVAEGIDVPGFPNSAIDISNTAIADASIFCFKTRGSYDSRAFSVAANSTNVVTVRGSTGTRCGMAAFVAAGGAQEWLENTSAVDTGMGPDGTPSTGIGGVAAYRFLASSALPTLDPSSAPLGMHILNATVSNPNSKYMQTAFHSENNPKDQRTYAMVHSYTVANPTAPKVTVSTNFTSVDATPMAVAAANAVVASASAN